MRKKPAGVPTLLGRKDNDLRFVRELPSEEFSAFLTANDHLREYWNSRSLIPLVERNEATYRQQVEEARVYQPDLSNSASIEKTRVRILELQFELNLALINYLTAFRLYLDQTHERLVKRHGRDSKELAEFVRWRGLAEEHEFAYRFIYDLRNFVQHGGLPITRLSVKGKRESPSLESPFKAEAEMAFDAQELLAEGDRWRMSKRDLKKIKAPIDLWQPIERATAALRQIRHRTFEAELPSLHESGFTVLKTIGDVLQMGQTPMVAVMETPKVVDGRQHLSYVEYHVHWEALEALALMERLPDGRIKVLLR